MAFWKGDKLRTQGVLLYVQLYVLLQSHSHYGQIWHKLDQRCHQDTR